MKLWKLYGIQENGKRQFLGEFKSRNEAESRARMWQWGQKVAVFSNEAKKFAIEKAGK